MTHRQFMVWQYWLLMQFNVPSRADYYAMQVANSMRAKPARSLDALKIQFKFKGQSSNHSVVMSRQVALSRMTMPAVTHEKDCSCPLCTHARSSN